MDGIFYHPSKANVVANALSHKFMGSLANILEARRLLIEEIHGLKVDGTKFEIKAPRLFQAHVELWSTLIDQTKAT